MPKKFANENSKAVAARAKKAESAKVKQEKEEKEKEDAKWADDFKHGQRKQERKENAEKKKLEALEKKKEREEQLKREEDEEKRLQARKGGQAQKLTRAQIRDEAEKREAIARGQASKEAKADAVEPLQENLNKVSIDGISASTVDEALSALSSKNAKPVDTHPEKRMKAAYEEFEKERMPALKEENVTLRLSQLKQLLRKEWQKHPNNPNNAKLAALQSRES